MSVQYETDSRMSAPAPNAWLGSLIDEQRDPTGLLYRRNRYYDPATGRFTQEDPIGLAGGMNVYGYANGDPINYQDPFGLCPAQGKDKAVCIDFFIEAEEVFFSEGDGRSFDKNAPETSSRIQLVVSPEGEITSKHVSRSCSVRGCFGPSNKNSISVEQGENGRFTVNVEAFNSAIPGAPAINASITFSPDGQGGFAISGSRDAFPSLGIYQYRGGALKPLYEESGKSFLHLVPGAPKSKFTVTP